MQLQEAISNRASYRGEFTKHKVTRQDLIDIVNAGILAPSGNNRQTTSYIMVDDQDILKQLSETIGLPKTATANAAICVVAREEISYRDVSFHMQNWSAAMENMLLTITEKGYATSWIEGQIMEGDTNNKMKSILSIPDNLILAVYMPIGVPKTPCIQAPKKTLEELSSFNQYQTK